jgi:exosome complex component RRP42
MNDIIWELKSDKIIAALKEGKRLDGRALDAYRKIVLERNISKNADSSARVKLGDTDIVVGIKSVPGEPFPDSPDEGSISVSAEFLPIASPSFESGPPSEESIELARVVDRGIRESKCLDFKKLCIREGELVWVVFIDIYTLNDDGNLFDASALASIASLLDARLPKLEEDKIVAGEYSGKIAVERQPVLSTFAKISETIVADPTRAEEKAMASRFSVATTEDNYLSAFQKGLGGSFTVSEIDHCIDIALARSKELRGLLKQ